MAPSNVTNLVRTELETDNGLPHSISNHISSSLLTANFHA